jgi:hypothetical protein
MTILKYIYNILFGNVNKFYSIDYTNNILTFDKLTIKINNMYNSCIYTENIKIEYKDLSEIIKYNLGTNLLNKSFHTDISKLNDILNDILNDNLNKKNKYFYKYVYNINKYCLEVLYNKYKYIYYQDNKKEKFIDYYKINIDHSKIDDLYLQSLELFFKDLKDDNIYKIYTNVDKSAITSYINSNNNIINSKDINKIETIINNNIDLKQIYDNIINTDNNFLINKFKQDAFINKFNNNDYLNSLLSFLKINNILETFIINDKDQYSLYINFIINNIDSDQIKQNAFIDHFKKNYTNILYLHCLTLFLLEQKNTDTNIYTDLNNYITNYVNKINNTTNINDLINDTDNYIQINFKDKFNNIFISNINLDIKKKIMLNYFQKKSTNTEELLNQIPNYKENNTYYNNDYYKHILFYMKDNNIDINVTDINDYKNNLNTFEKLLYNNTIYKNYILSLNIDKKESLINYYQYYKKKLFNFCKTLHYYNENSIIFNNLSIQNKKNALLKGLNANSLNLLNNNNLNYYIEIYLHQQKIDINNIENFIYEQLEENYENIIYEYIYSNIYINHLKKDINTNNDTSNILNSIHLIKTTEYDDFCKKYDKNVLHKINNDIILYVIKNNLLKDQNNQINSIFIYIADICNKYVHSDNIIISKNLNTYISDIFKNNNILHINVIFLYLKCFFKTNNIIKYISDNNIINNISELSQILLSYIFLLNDNNIDILYINDFIFSEYDDNYIFNYKNNITEVFYKIFKNIQIKKFTNCEKKSLFLLNILDFSYSIIYNIKCNNCNTTTQCKLLRNFIIDDRFNVFKNISCDNCKKIDISIDIIHIPDYLIFYNRNHTILDNYLELKVDKYNFKLKYVITLNNTLIENIKNNDDDNIKKSSVYLFYKLCKCDISKQACDC